MFFSLCLQEGCFLRVVFNAGALNRSINKKGRVVQAPHSCSLAPLDVPRIFWWFKTQNLGLFQLEIQQEIVKDAEIYSIGHWNFMIFLLNMLRILVICQASFFGAGLSIAKKSPQGITSYTSGAFGWSIFGDCYFPICGFYGFQIYEMGNQQWWWWSSWWLWWISPHFPSGAKFRKQWFFTALSKAHSSKFGMERRKKSV